MSESTPAQSFFIKHEFAIRRLHSLTGIVPLGAYMCVHLVTNASLLNGTETFQRAVFTIHSLGRLLPLVEWGFIFGPLLFHAILGVWIVKTGKSNTGSYQYASNKRYVWQRWTGLLAVVFLFTHVLHLHGWFHSGIWLAIVEPIGMAQFRPYNAASTLMKAMQGFVWPVFYLAGVLALVFHLANGIWTAGITWGLWISPKAQQRATKVCTAFGLIMALVGVSAWWGAVSPGEDEIAAAEAVEDEMYEAALKTGLAYDMPHKRSDGHDAAEEEPTESDSASNTQAKTEDQSFISRQTDVDAND